MPNIKASWRVGFYQDRRGQSPVLDFINDLPAPDRARIDMAIRLLKEFGTALGMPHARPL